jgi:hypothetical protein
MEYPERASVGDHYLRRAVDARLQRLCVYDMTITGVSVRKTPRVAIRRRIGGNH